MSEEMSKVGGKIEKGDFVCLVKPYLMGCRHYRSGTIFYVMEVILNTLDLRLVINPSDGDNDKPYVYRNMPICLFNVHPIIQKFRTHIAQLEAENAELKERLRNNHIPPGFERIGTIHYDLEQQTTKYESKSNSTEVTEMSEGKSLRELLDEQEKAIIENDKETALLLLNEICEACCISEYIPVPYIAIQAITGVMQENQERHDKAAEMLAKLKAEAPEIDEAIRRLDKALRDHVSGDLFIGSAEMESGHPG